MENGTSLKANPLFIVPVITILNYGILMRFGLVKFVNAWPLVHGIRRWAREKPDEFQIHEDTPARLADMLMAGDLDCALISSVECIRNHPALDYYDGVGVCADTDVRSILYITLNSRETIRSDFKPEHVYTDSGSRSSVALLDILLFEKFGQRIPFRTTGPDLIPEQINENSAGLLIGDSALRFLDQGDRSRFHTTDMALWWRKVTGLPFVFALWAFPAGRSGDFDTTLFDRSLEEGLNSLDELVIRSPYSDSMAYFTENLHYHLRTQDRQALGLFKEKLNSLDELTDAL